MSGQLALESQGGDPSLPEETLTAATGFEAEAQFAKKDAQLLFAQQFLATAGADADAGVSRHSSETRVTEHLNLLGLEFADENGAPYPLSTA